MAEQRKVVAYPARGALPPATLDLDAAGLADRRPRPRRDAWVLAGEGIELELGGAAGARMRLVRHGVTYLLVGANGHPSVLAAIQAARGGETVLVAPGTYREQQAFVIDRPVTLQGVTDQGEPVVHAGDVVATVIAMHGGKGSAGFAIEAPGVAIQGLAFVAAEYRRAELVGAGMASQVRVLDAAGRLRYSCADIQAALDAAEAGDRIMVPEGRHVGDLTIRTNVTLAGRNAGRSGGSSRREIESTLLGRIVMGPGAGAVVLDGLVVWGGFTLEPATTQRRFALRNCVIDGRDGGTAIRLARGTASEIVNNLIYGGSDAAIRIDLGFDGLSLCGNYIEAAAGTAGIALCGGAQADRVEILGNTFLDGNYGVLLHAGHLGRHGGTVVLSGNHFGRHGGGAPLVAGVHADGVLPAALAASLGASLPLNNYHARPPATDVDVVFERTEGGAACPVAAPAVDTLRQSGAGR